MHSYRLLIAIVIRRYIPASFDWHEVLALYPIAKAFPYLFEVSARFRVVTLPFLDLKS